MHIQKLEVNARDNLIILDDRGQYCRHADSFLEEKLAKAGCAKKLHVLVQIKLEGDCWRLLRERFPHFKSDAGCVLIFPGRSAAKIRKTVEWNDCYTGPIIPNHVTFTSIYAERHFDQNGNPKATVGEVFPGVTVCTKTQTVIVFDDVISSGATMRACFEKNHYKFPKALWYACAPISRRENIKGYKEVITPLLVPPDALGLKIPINSLTTLFEDAELARSYCAKHCFLPSVFADALSVVSTEYGECGVEGMDLHLIPWRDAVED